MRRAVLNVPVSAHRVIVSVEPAWPSAMQDPRDGSGDHAGDQAPEMTHASTVLGCVVSATPDRATSGWGRMARDRGRAVDAAGRRARDQPDRRTTCAGSPTSGARLRRLRRAVALVGHRPRRVLAVDLGLLRGHRARPTPTAALAGAAMPGARWFPGATLNYAEHVLRMPGLRRRRAGRASRTRQTREPGHAHRRGSCASRSAGSRAGLRRLGVSARATGSRRTPRTSRRRTC